jgi:hypothetical protein
MEVDSINISLRIVVLQGTGMTVLAYFSHVYFIKKFPSKRGV